MDHETYALIDIEGYASQMREAAASSISDNYNSDDLNEYITIQQIINLTQSECLGFDDLDRPLLDEETNETIFETIATWIHGVGLARLAAQDLVECAWDNDQNEMIFWAKEKTKKNAKRKSGRKNKKSEG